MKRQIRMGVFESNSSSTHAICISEKSPDIDNLPDHITFTHGEFGWENQIYDDMSDRASYLYQALCDLHGKDEEGLSDDLNEIVGTLAKYGISCNFEPPKENVWGFNYGHIDHGYEAQEFVDAVMHSENRLLRYLCGKDSFIVTGNDNNHWWGEWMEENGPRIRKDHEIYEKFN